MTRGIRVSERRREAGIQQHGQGVALSGEGSLLLLQQEGKSEGDRCMQACWVGGKHFLSNVWEVRGKLVGCR